MEPQIIDHYNELPQSVHVIDKMNEEFSELQKENDKLKENLNNLPELDYMKRFQMPVIIYDDYKEYKSFQSLISMFGDFAVLNGNSAGCGLTMDDESIQNIIMALNVITQYKNPVWCEYRIKISLDLCNSFIFDEYDENPIFKNLVFGIDHDDSGKYCDLPLTYKELSKLYSPQNCDEYHNIHHIGHFKCPKCQNILNYIDMEDDFYDEIEENCNNPSWCYPPIH